MSNHDPNAPFDSPSTDVLPRLPDGRTTLKLLVVGGVGHGRELLLERGTYRVGKAPANDLVLDDASVSRTHLEVDVLERGVRLVDLGSTNGSFLNGARFVEVEAGAGALLKVGKSELRLVPAAMSGLAPSERDAFGRLIGKSLPMRQLFALLERVAPSDASVVLHGETGTGKELCAEALHQASRRAAEPFVVIDLAGIQPNLIESELFGHVRGAFTGASADRAGAFERAHGGTVFLDEVGELPPELQPRLLRALENRQAKRVGGNDYKRFDVRVVAASHRDLLAETKAGRFREDLYHRLAVVKLTLPPLRERREDIPLLVAKMLAALGRGHVLGPQTLAQLAAYDWPGNVRELRNVVERAVSLGGGDEEVPPEILDLPAASSGGPSSSLPFKEAKEQLVAAFEKEYVAGLIARCDGNVSLAAREAGIDRVYLHRLLKKHGLAER